ncbi:myrosinase 1 [Dendroctonus ponderosae]|uniref:Beta-glucosidase n=1 Tax=Dendroctonus ponderosae TaxID=77166 RepID=U4UIW9_DENPD|nr:myrosinase 1 [Dendroctonus ponderosae]ERL94004.1 hypothetical protein D910_11289 [Dendroctonus ponderosae]
MLKLLLLVISIIASSQADKQIPQDFLIGAGTSAFQIEGAWNEDGKGESIWDTFLHDKNAQENGDIACDSYHKWEEDVANAKALGLDFYRFSIAWTRILPNGTLNNINQQGIDYYLNLIKALKAEGIEPMITIYHWDMPQHIYELGGLLNTQFVDYFGDFARLVYQNYAPYVKYWFTINEPTLVCNGGYGSGFMAPGLHLIGDGIYQCGYVLLQAHARAYRIYEEEFKPLYHGHVGLVINFDWAEAATDSSADLEAQERYIEFELGWWANPIFLGNWPQIMIDRIADRSRLEGFARSRLPEFTEEEINYINGTHDFFALNTYGVGQVEDEPEPEIGEPSYVSDEAVRSVRSNDFYYPEGLRTSVNYINQKYQPRGIIITENGKGIRQGDSLDDQERINTIRDFMSALVDAAVEDGVNVIGYSVWSLMDNFEWGSYESKFGIIQVDFESPDKTRTWKESAKWYQNVATTRILDV